MPVLPTLSMALGFLAMASTNLLTRDSVDKILAEIKKFTGNQVLVGIPDTGAGRTAINGVGDKINNARLGYIHEFGSPASNIPARAFLIPGVNKVLSQCIEYLKLGAKEALSGNAPKARSYMDAAGTVASNSVRNVFTNNNWQELKPKTIAKRARQRGDKTRRPAEIKYLALVAGGQAPAAAQTQAGIQTLINTAQLQRSITYVIRKV